MGLFCSFFLPLELKSQRTYLCKPEVAETLCFLLGHFEGVRLLIPFSGFIAEQSIQPRFYLSPSCLLKTLRETKLWHPIPWAAASWRCGTPVVHGIAFPLPVCSKGHHHIPCSGAGPTPPGAFNTQGLLTWRNLPPEITWKVLIGCHNIPPR